MRELQDQLEAEQYFSVSLKTKTRKTANLLIWYVIFLAELTHLFSVQTLYKTQVKELKEEIEEKNRQVQEASKKVQELCSERYEAELHSQTSPTLSPPVK